MDAFLGTWTLVKEDGYDEYLQKLGVDFVTRNAEKMKKPSLTFARHSQRVDEYTMQKTKTAMGEDISFKLGVPYQDTIVHGYEVKSTITLIEPNELQTVQVGGPHNIIRTSQVEGDVMKVVS